MTNPLARSSTHTDSDSNAPTAGYPHALARPRYRYRHPFGLARLLLLSLCFAVISQAKAQEDHFQAIELKRDQVERVQKALANTPAELRDGLNFRVDALTSELGRLILDFPQTELESVETRERFFNQLDWLHAFIAQRFDILQIRIREERARFDEFDDSMQATISRTFQHDLRKVSSSYVGMLAKLLALSEDLGRVDGPGREQLRESAVLAAERLSGQILLDAMTLTELRSILRVDADNAELIRAERAIERKQVRSLESLEQLVGLMERMDVNTGSYRALLLAERGSIGVELLNREVFSTLLGAQLDAAYQQLITRGPNVLFKAIVFLGILLLTYFVAKLAQHLAQLVLKRDSVKLAQLLEDMLVSLAFGVVFAVGLIIALSSIGISLVPMLAGLGVAGIVIGFALQDTLSNFASGWMILVYRPYDVDDHVVAGGVEGVVRRMNLVSTTIATFDNQRLVIPNSKIWGDVITNLTANHTRRLTIPVSVAFGEDLDRVERVLREEVAGHEGILAEPEPNVFVDTLGSSEIVMVTHAWVRTEDYWRLLRSLTKRLKQRLDDEDMEIPFPQQDVYIRSFPASALPGSEKKASDDGGVPPGTR